MDLSKIKKITQGIRRYLLIDDKEVTNWFSREGDIVFSSNSLYHRKAGFEFVEILEALATYQSKPLTMKDSLNGK